MREISRPWWSLSNTLEFFKTSESELYNTPSRYSELITILPVLLQRFLLLFGTQQKWIRSGRRSKRWRLYNLDILSF